MAQTQILVFDPDFAASPLQSALVEAAWPLPQVRIADLAFDYGQDGRLDVDRERRRLAGVTTVVIQLAEAALRSSLLGTWLSKVLALDGAAGSGAGPVVPRLRAVLVRNGRSADRPHRGLGGLRRLVESAGVEWLEPQIIDPGAGRAAVAAELSLFGQRLIGREPPPNLARATRARAAASFRGRLQTGALRASLGLAAAQLLAIGLSAFDMEAAKAAQDLLFALLGVGLAAGLASLIGHRSGAGAAVWLAFALGLWTLQLVVGLLPDGLTVVVSAVAPPAVAAVLAWTMLARSRADAAGPA